MKWKYLILICLSALLSGNAISQTININEEPKVSQMMTKFVEEGRLSSAQKAWRIQIITTDDRRKMEAARAKFTRMYPDEHIEWEHVMPYYKVKVGSWEDKRSLQVFLLELKSAFPSSIPVMDNIDKRDLVN